VKLPYTHGAQLLQHRAACKTLPRRRGTRALSFRAWSAHLGSRGRTSPLPTINGIRLGIVDQICLLDVAGSDGTSLRIAAHCVAEYVNGLYSPMGRTRRSAAPAAARGMVRPRCLPHLMSLQLRHQRIVGLTILGAQHRRMIEDICYFGRNNARQVLPSLNASRAPLLQARRSRRDACRKRSTPLVLAPTPMYLFCSQAQKPVFCSNSYA